MVGHGLVGIYKDRPSFFCLILCMAKIRKPCRLESFSLPGLHLCANQDSVIAFGQVLGVENEGYLTIYRKFVPV